jgi:hypothetical protein
MYAAGATDTFKGTGVWSGVQFERKSDPSASCSTQDSEQKTQPERQQEATPASAVAGVKTGATRGEKKK